MQVRCSFNELTPAEGAEHRAIKNGTEMQPLDWLYDPDDMVERLSLVVAINSSYVLFAYWLSGMT